MNVAKIQGAFMHKIQSHKNFYAMIFEHNLNNFEQKQTIYDRDRSQKFISVVAFLIKS